MAENLITVREAASFLRISARTVYRLIESGQIGAVRIGKQWRIRTADLPGLASTETVPAVPVRRENTVNA